MEMESPFFRNRRWYQQPDASFNVPAYRVDSIDDYPVYRTQEKRSYPKVVTIPVHFVGSEQVDRTECAVKIQKAFRGYLVRKCLNKVKDIKVQVDEIEEKLLKSEVVELVRKEEKERLRMNETLMSLLLKLDSICGVDFGVRSCRKAVIRKVIALQERIDANSDENRQISDPSIDLPACLEDSGSSTETEIIDVGVDCEVKASGRNPALAFEDLRDKNDGEVDDGRRNGELVEKMMEEREKMRKVMSELYDRNEKQMKMLNALTNRVELLERAFLSNKRLTKKKRVVKTVATC